MEPLEKASGVVGEAAVILLDQDLTTRDHRGSRGKPGQHQREARPQR